MFDSPEAQFAIDAVREASLLARRIQREMVGSGAHQGRPLAGHGRRLRGPGPHRPATGRATSRLGAHRRGTRRRPAARRRRRDARPDHRVRPHGDSRRHAGGSLRPDRSRQRRAAADVLDARPDRRHQGLSCVASSTRSHWRSFDDGKVELGVLGCPELQTPRPDRAARFARRRRPRPRHVDAAARRRRRLAAAQRFRRARAAPTPACCAPSKRRTRTSTKSANSPRSSASPRRPSRMDSQAKYAVLAAGDGDVLLRLLSPSRPDYREKIWDQAAGSIVDRRSGRPNHRPRRQAARFLPRPHARQKPRHSGHERPSARRSSRRPAGNRRVSRLRLAARIGRLPPHAISRIRYWATRRLERPEELQGLPTWPTV